MKQTFIFFVVSILLYAGPYGTDSLFGNQSDDWSARMDSEFVGEFQLRSLGPHLKPGRVSDVVLDPRNNNIWYLSFGSGGVWKTVNRGTSWKPIFDGGGSYSIGCLAVDPHDSNVVWLGTGENSSNRSVGYGDGIYKSTDAGKTWKHMGLTDSQHIAKIIIDPRDSEKVYVAAEGPLWSDGGDRGLYKTINGGKIWKAVLEVSQYTGITSVALDPENPDTVYAASYQRRRHVGVLVGGGPESAIFKSTNGGSSWKKLTNGIPSSDKGRIALAVSPQKSEIVYALVTAAGNESGFFRSTDRGESWTRQSNYKLVDPQYYGEIYPDPHRFDHIFSVDMMMQETEDGGRNFKPVTWQMHVDYHALVLNPADSNHLLVGNDGGLYESVDGGNTWRHFTNLSTAQLYRVAVDNALPFYNVHGGTRDNGSFAGPSRTVNQVGIRTSDWIQTGGGDGFQARIDPSNLNIFYTMSQNGDISRYDKKTGSRVGIRPPAEVDGKNTRWHWDTPFIISPHSPSRLYFAGNRLFRSENRGDSWLPVSPDLTRELDREKVPLMGRVWGKDAVQKHRFTTTLSVSTAMSESILKEGLLIIGTDDGLLQISSDGGEQWHRIDRFPGIPKWTYISDVCTSRHDIDTLYVAFNNHQVGDFKPYLIRSEDGGKTWVSIAGNMPYRHIIWTVVEDHVNKNLLFVGTELGLFFTVDGGKHWIQLRASVPTVSFRDLTIQRHENDLVAATFGRGFYILDDYTPLRHLTAENLAQEYVLFPPRAAYIYNELGFETAVFGNVTTANPEFGASLTYYLKDGLTEDKNNFIQLKIMDGQDKLVRTIKGSATPGLHRLVWDLRPESAPVNQERRRRRRRPGPLVKPGIYTVLLSKTVNEQESELGTPQTIEVKPLPDKTK
jgi:photosystem II stability/assembly factor-like uncharacterized protein